jgi:phosphate transport system substrate-binding protein
MIYLAQQYEPGRERSLKLKRFLQWKILVATWACAMLLTPSGGVATAQNACPAGGSTTRLDGAGATFPAPLYTRWFSDYKTACGIEINYQAIGSGGGIRQHTERTVAFGASDGILTSEQKTAAPGTLMIPTVAGAVAIVLNIPGVQRGQLRLTAETLARIYQGEITRWDDQRIREANPNLSLPNLDVIVVRRSDGSGTTNIFTSYLAAVSSGWARDIGVGNSVNWPVGLGGEGNAGVAGQVRRNWIEPSLAATTAAMEGVEIPESTEVMIVDSENPDAYPIAGFTWILVYENQSNLATARTLATVLWWVTHEGQATASQLEYAPLSPAAQAAAEAQIRRITTDGVAVIP